MLNQLFLLACDGDQSINFGDDALLFGVGRHGNRQYLDVAHAKMLDAAPNRDTFDQSPYYGRLERCEQE